MQGDNPQPSSPKHWRFIFFALEFHRDDAHLSCAMFIQEGKLNCSKVQGILLRNIVAHAVPFQRRLAADVQPVDFSLQQP